MPRLLARLGVVTAAGLALMVGGGLAASAHVSVHSDDAVHGGFAEIAFRVPTESDTASTVKLQVAFPADAPIAEVSVLPHLGWTYRVTRSDQPAAMPHGHGGAAAKAVSQIEWTATGSDTAVKPGEYEVFRIAAGPLPATDKLVFKAVQTYDDGQQVRWIDLPTMGGPEPERPAPVLPLGAASTAGHGGTAPMTSVGAAAAPAPAWWVTGAAGVALLAAFAAVLLALRSFQRKGGDVPATEP